MTQTSLLITRPIDSATRFEASLSTDVRKDVEIVISPLLEIVPMGVVPDIASVEGVVFTSAQAVALAPSGIGLPAYCVGALTAARATQAGWHVRAEEENAESLIARVIAMQVKGPILHLAGAHRRGKIAERLTEQGISSRVQVLYDQRALPLSGAARRLFGDEHRVIVPLFSPRTATQLIGEALNLRNATLVCMSAAVAQQCEGSGAAGLVTLPAPTACEMVRCVEKLLCGPSLA